MEMWREYEQALIVEEVEIENKIKQRIVDKMVENQDIQLNYFKQILEYYGLEVTSENIISEVLMYGLMFNINTEELPFENFYKKMYWLIQKITGAEVQILMIPSKGELDKDLFYQDIPCIIYDKRTEKNRNREIKLQDKPLASSEYLREITYEQDTYYIDGDRKKVFIKYSINLKHSNRKDNVYVILKYKNEQEMRKILFDIRFLLLYRSRTITRMKRDFNNNLFQSLWQTKKHNMLLEHFKNVTHINPEEENAIGKNINYVWTIDKYCNTSADMEKGIKIYKVLLLKMLADNNISSIYHKILAKRLICNYVRCEKFETGGIFSNVEDFKYIMCQEDESSTEWWFNNITRAPLIEIKEEVRNSFVYYIAPGSFVTQLIIISMIQNAYRHGNGKRKICVYREEGKIVGNQRIDKLCISNGINVNDSNIIKQRIEEHIRKPVTSRKSIGNNDKCEGITLFSLNYYCKKIVERLQEKECKEELLEYEIKRGSIVIKIPILKGEL